MQPSPVVRPVAVRAPSSGHASPVRGSPSPSSARRDGSVPASLPPRPKHDSTHSDPPPPRTLAVGVVGIQGAFREHMIHLARAGRLIESEAEAAYLAAGRKKHDVHKQSLACENVRVTSRLVRAPEDLDGLAGLILPGGESTAIALGMQRSGLLEPLRAWVAADRPTWGTCAGMILLSREASAGKRGGQALIGGIDARIERNGYGSQTASFETSLDMPVLGPEPFPAVFIRAPVLDCLLDPDTPSPYIEPAAEEDTSVSRSSLPVNVAPPLPREPGKLRPPIQILGSLAEPVALPPDSHVHPPYALARDDDPSRATTPRPLVPLSGVPSAQAHTSETVIGVRPEHDAQIVAIRQGNLMATSFHPELTPDARLHKYFITHIVSPATQVAKSL